MDKIKLTKSALNKFIVWSTSRYNDYLGFGNKKYNVELVYEALKVGYLKVKKWREEEKDYIFEQQPQFQIKCAGGVGENPYSSSGNKYWKLKGRAGDYKYEIDCVAKTIKGIPSGKMLHFI